MASSNIASSRDPAVKTENLVKKFRSTMALDSLSVSIPTGKITGFLGPNGAGKTTFFRVLLGLASINSGRVEVFGHNINKDLDRVIRRISAVLDKGLMPYLNALDNMKVVATTLGVDHGQVDSLLEFVGLTKDARRLVKGYSRGMKQRLYLGTALLGDPDLMLLDEPLNGLDPDGQATLRSRFRQLSHSQGKTIIVSSHVLSDIEAIADHIVVISQGRLITSGTLEEVIAGQEIVEVKISEPARAHKKLTDAGMEVKELESRDSPLQVIDQPGEKVIQVLAENLLYPASVIPIRKSLETAFINLLREDKESNDTNSDTNTEESTDNSADGSDPDIQPVEEVSRTIA